MLHSDALQIARGMPSGGFRPEEPESINLEAILRFARKRRRLCLVWLLGGLLLGIGYAALSAPSYTATAAVLLEDPTPRTAGDVAVAQSDAAHSTYIETQLQIFASNEIIARVVDALNLVQDPEFGQNAGGLVSWLMHEARSLVRSHAEPDPRHATVVRVRRAFAVHRIGISDVLEIQFTSTDPDRAADFASAIIRAYVDSRVAEQEGNRKTRAEHDWKLLAELRDKAFPAVRPGEATASIVAPGPEARAQFLEEQQKTESYRALYGRLLQRALGNTDAQLPSPGLEVLTPATPPLIASSRLISVVAFVAVGGIAGLAHALLREITDDVLRTADDLRIFTDIARVAVIPKLDKTELRYERSSRDNAQSSYGVDCRRAYDAAGKLAVAMLDANIRRSRRLIGVVSPQEGAGASLVAAQLAKVLADTGSNTCLVDANWRSPLSDVSLPDETLYGRLTGWKENTASMVGTLDVLTLRAAAPVSDLTASLSIVTALESAGVEHQWIVVDFHSLAQTMDLEVAINLIDQVVVIVEAQRTTGQGLRGVLNIVPPGKLAGIVLNKVKIKGKRSRKQGTPYRHLETAATGRRVVTDLLG
jgi:Mrp family chromosome partitioning ATPase/capsular polysaccharide biosynthesis protein